MKRTSKHITDSDRNADEEMLYQMATVGFFSPKPSDIMALRAFVNAYEGDVPHMHIWDDETNGHEFHTCVCLTAIEYFHHDGSEDTLSPEQKEQLVEFLNAECKKNKRYKTNWEYTLSMWNDNNEQSTQVDEYAPVLDYTKLK